MASYQIQATTDTRPRKELAPFTKSVSAPILDVGPEAIAAIAADSPCELRSDRRLLLLKREHDGEVWVTWLPGEIEEHGVGATSRDAIKNLWGSLCTYLGSLEESEDHLSPKLARELETLRKFIRQR